MYGWEVDGEHNALGDFIHPLGRAALALSVPVFGKRLFMRGEEGKEEEEEWGRKTGLTTSSARGAQPRAWTTDLTRASRGAGPGPSPPSPACLYQFVACAPYSFSD